MYLVKLFCSYGLCKFSTKYTKYIITNFFHIIFYFNDHSGSSWLKGSLGFESCFNPLVVLKSSLVIFFLFGLELEGFKDRSANLLNSAEKMPVFECVWHVSNGFLSSGVSLTVVVGLTIKPSWFEIVVKSPISPKKKIS